LAGASAIHGDARIFDQGAFVQESVRVAAAGLEWLAQVLEEAA